MPTKLTLRIEEELIERAKAYSRETGKSVSQLVAGYLAALPRRQSEEPVRQTPIARSLRGMLRGAEIDAQAYRRHLEEKYL
ncbi:MAG TPA: DUF6364 family protein [Thermoanaerobaculia bacterium]|nr:DUF6364 family protein [Thermoanaerobaculia bacterium]